MKTGKIFGTIRLVGKWAMREDEAFLINSPTKTAKLRSIKLKKNHSVRLENNHLKCQQTDLWLSD